MNAATVAGGGALVCCFCGAGALGPWRQAPLEEEEQEEEARRVEEKEVLAAATERRRLAEEKEAAEATPQKTGDVAPVGIKDRRVRAQWPTMTKNERSSALRQLLAHSSDSDEEEEKELPEVPMQLRPHTGDGCLEIPRVAANEITPEDFEERYIQRSLPVILTGAMDSWPAFADKERRWSIEKFKQRFSDTAVTVDAGGSKERLQLGEYLGRFPRFRREQEEHWAAGGKGVGAVSMQYLRTWFFADVLPELVDDFSTPPHFADDAFRRLPPDMVPPFQWLFFGPRGTESKLHVDVWETDAWLGNLEGKKLFTLYHPSMRPYIERGENEFADLLGPTKPIDPALFPDFHKATPAQAILRAGEIIYIPRRWPHHAVSLTDAVSLTLNFCPPANSSATVKHLLPYMRNRGRVQEWMGRVLKADDNLMQLCVHGGTIQYGDAEQPSVAAKNPMAEGA